MPFEIFQNYVQVTLRQLFVCMANPNFYNLGKNLLQIGKKMQNFTRGNHRISVAFWPSKNHCSCNCKLLLRDFSYDCWEAFSFFHSLTIAGSTNLIEDGFYDAGQIRPNTKFMSIEDYCKQELNDKRPILFINAKAEYVKKCKINLTNPNFEYLGILFVQISPSFIFLELHFL